MPNTPSKIYYKDYSYDPIYKSVNYPFLFKSKMFSGALMGLGFFILGTQVVWPLVSFKTQKVVSRPAQETVLGMASGYSEFIFEELNNKPKEDIEINTNVPDNFYISIPKLKIVDAVVNTNSSNLNPDNALGHYKGTSLPGNVGNAFIYGHSVLPWFYNPENYKTIFSTIGDLSAGDEIIVKYNQKEMVYKVESKEVLDPKKVNPLAEIKPRYLNEATITLMTCWPAGTKAKRLLVKGTLRE